MVQYICKEIRNWNVELVNEYKILIEKLVKTNPKYSGNEDLLEDFCSETYKKSYLILQSVDNEKSLEAYLKKVVSSAIMDVLRDNGRIVRSTKGYKSVQLLFENPSDYTRSVGEALAAEKHDENKQNSHDVLCIHPEISAAPSIGNDILNIKDPKESIEEQIIRKDIIENIINLVKQIDAEQPREKYLKIFYMRYFLHKKQKEIAQEVFLSQAETSKRLLKLSRLIKEKLYY